MARKSRRGNGNKSQKEINSIKSPVICAVVYLRLSSKNKSENDSIKNQRAIIDGYLEMKPEINVFKYYVDDGVSSYREYRPAFAEMMQDIKYGLINTVIVKDISRFGRNYIKTGEYLETIFPRIGIRFIAISEGIDSLDIDNKDYEIAIKSLLNHYYSQDISVKVKSVVKQKQITGEYVAARVPYGYMKLFHEGRTIYVLDPEKADVVRKIFEMVLNGVSYYQIAGELNREEIQSPGGNVWTVKAVSRIVNNRFYIGILETGKTESTLGSMKPFISNEKQDWIVIDNHHEAIVDTETYEKIQRIVEAKQDKRLKTKRETKVIRGNIFDKFLYCGNCGRKMKKQIWAERIYYVCPKYSETKGACSLKSWREDRIINALIREIEEQIDFLEKEFIGIDEKSDNCIKDKISKNQEEISCLVRNRDITYDDYMESEKFDLKNLREDLDDINIKILNLEKEVSELSLQIDRAKEIHKRINFLKRVSENMRVLSKDHDDAQNDDDLFSKIDVFKDRIEIEYKSLECQMQNDNG